MIGLSYNPRLLNLSPKIEGESLLFDWSLKNPYFETSPVISHDLSQLAYRCPFSIRRFVFSGQEVQICLKCSLNCSDKFNSADGEKRLEILPTDDIQFSTIQLL